MRVLRFAVALLVVLVVHLLLVRVAPQAARAVDLFVLVLVYFAMTASSAGGLLLGTAAGLTQDIALGSPLGLNGFAGTLAGYVVSRTARQIESTQMSVASVFFAVGVAVHEAARSLLVYLLVEAANPPSLIWVGVRVLSAAVLGLLLLVFRGRIDRRLDRWRQLRRRRVRIGAG